MQVPLPVNGDTRHLLFLRNAQWYTNSVVLTREATAMARLILFVLFPLAPMLSAASEGIHVGAEAPPFALPDLFGRTIKLDYFGGHPGVVVFWSSTSPQSAELLEDFREYQERWGQDDLAIVAVNADRGQFDADRLQAVRDYTDRLNIIFPVLLDRDGSALTAYDISELPTAVVIDAGGRISSIVRGSEPARREQLKESILAALRGGLSRLFATTTPVRVGGNGGSALSPSPKAMPRER